MSRKYKTPPIIEAVCEFQFDPTSSWSLVYPGLIYEQVKPEFPQTRTRRMMRFALQPCPDSVTQEMEATDLTQFLQPGQPFLIQVGMHILTINHVAPYSSWNNFLSHIQQAYEIYTTVASPKSIAKIGLRFINQISIPEQEFSFDLLSFRPHLGAWEPNRVKFFVVGAEIHFPEEHGLIRVQLTNNIPQKAGVRSLILDLDYILTMPGLIAVEDAVGWVDNVHSQIETAFENSITDELREFFGEIR